MNVLIFFLSEDFYVFFDTLNLYINMHSTQIIMTSLSEFFKCTKKSVIYSVEILWDICYKSNGPNFDNFFTYRFSITSTASIIIYEYLNHILPQIKLDQITHK